MFEQAILDREIKGTIKQEKHMNDAKRQCEQNVETGVMGAPTVECQQVNQVPEPATTWLVAAALLIAVAARKIGQRAR